MEKNTLINSISGTIIEYYGGDIMFNNVTTTKINSTQSSIIISQRCSSSNSILIGGETEISTYNLKLLREELSVFSSKNIEFNSYNGTIYIAGFDQSIDMNDIKWRNKICFIYTKWYKFKNYI